jgi:hypothetical protein
VAKKRRKQETGIVVNQMFAYCCGHATIVAPRQPLFWLIPCGCRSSQPRRRKVAPIGHNWAVDKEFSLTRESTRTDIARPTTKVNSARPRALQRIAQHDSRDICSAGYSIAAIAHSEVMTSNIHHARNGSRHFCAAGAFCASFRHVMTLHAPCAPRAESASIQGRTTSCATCRRRF